MERKDHMRTRRTFVAALSAVVCLVLGQQVYGQRGMGMQGRGSAGWGPGTPYARMYDQKTVETISGEVASLETLTPMQGMGAGLHLLLKTDKGVISVHLGPAWYLENQDVSLQPGDRVQVRGSRITFQGKPAIIAAEVTRGDEVLHLRDEAGFPLWAGWRRR
jgi:hypothetical protein